MRAVVGDRLHVHGRIVGDPEHAAEIIEIRGENGSPPYVVRYDDGRENIVVPGADAWVEHHPA